MYIILLIKSEKKNQKYEQSKGEKAGAGDWFLTFFFFLSVLNTGRIAKYVPRLRNKWFLEERFYFQNANFA